MEEESKIPFWKKIKTSIFGLEEYQKLAAQKITKTIAYIVILMLIFAFFITLCVTYQFHTTVNQVGKYIDENIQILNFDNGILTIQDNNGQEEIIIEEAEVLNGKIIINTGDISDEQVQNYTEEIKTYNNGVVILQDEVIFKTIMTNIPTTISLQDISEQYHLVKLDKQDIVNLLTGNQLYTLDAMFLVAMFIYLWIIYFATVLLDAILYSLLAYITTIFARLRLKYSAIYNIAVYSMTLPIILNLIYIMVNILTGYTIQYFSVMYMAITCIYIITSILMIKSDVIKKQIELSKIIEEQERIRQEMARKEQEQKEEEERERIRKEDEKKRKEEKKKEQKKEKNETEGTGKQDNGPEPQANIKPSE